MSMTDDPVRFELRRDTAANWTANNPVLLAGEPGYELDTSRMKIGDGSSTWGNLPYLYLQPSQVGEAGGVASLALSGLVPVAQLGTGSANASTVLHGDGTWGPEAGGGSPNLDGGAAATVYTTGQGIDGGNA